MLSCFDLDDDDASETSNAHTPPADNAFENGLGQGNSSTSTFSSLNGTTVLYYQVFPNNSGDANGIQPDWRDDQTVCTVGASLAYPITGTDGIYTNGKHSANPTATSGSIRAADYCDGLFESGWRYYHDPTNPTKALFSIKHGANTTPIEYIEMRRDNSGSRFVKNEGSGYGYFVMARDWFIHTVNDADLTAAVSIRFYFDPADSTDMQNAANEFAALTGGGVGSIFSRTARQ